MMKGVHPPMKNTPASERVHIGFFGVRNAGKSSLVNAVTGQDLSVVSDTRGTTTDAISKTMELLPIGPVVIIDTPGIDDEGELGELRVLAARKALRKCDVAVLVAQAGRELLPAEAELLGLFEERKMPHVIAWNKADLLPDADEAFARQPADDGIFVSATQGRNIYELKELIGRRAVGAKPEKRLVSDLVRSGDVVVLVIPIDSAAPKGRIILPQQMVLRDCLDSHVTCLCCQVGELAEALAKLKEPPALVITDSQAFGAVSDIVPDSVPLTSFSILMARYKGELAPCVEGARAIAGLTDASRVLLAEGCTHHRQCDDIGTVKIPAWVRQHCGADPQFEFCSGNGFPDDLSPYDLVIHCGACMLNMREMEHRLTECAVAGVPIVNYGIAIAHMQGILERAIRPLQLGDSR
jgi:[FeFe] hydrogenase H-cluster maturation GTPase HydF